MSVLQKERPFNLHMHCRDNDGLLRLQWLKLTVLLLSSGGSTTTQCTGYRNTGGHKPILPGMGHTTHHYDQCMASGDRDSGHITYYLSHCFSLLCLLTTVTKSANGTFLRMHSSQEVILDCTLRICIIGFYINIILQSIL